MFADRTIDFREITAYAARFPEIRMIGSRPVDVSTLQRSAIAHDGPIQSFAGMKVGTLVVPGMTISALTLRAGEIDVDIAGFDKSFRFILGAPNDGPAWPFDVESARIGYHPAQTAFPVIEQASVGFRLLVSRQIDSIPGPPADRWRRLVSQAVSERRAMTGEPNPAIVERRPDGKVYVRVTGRCQERCVFCFFYDSHSEADLATGADLEAETLSSVKMLDPDRTTQVILTGGEPTLAPRFSELLSGLLERGFENIVVQTNGILPLQAGMLDKFEPWSDRVSFGFSLHAPFAEISNRITGAGTESTFAAKLDAIRHAVTLGYMTKITCVLTTVNLPVLPDLVRFCLSLKDCGQGLEKVVLQLSMPTIRGLMEHHRDLYPRLDDVRKAVEPALDLADAAGLRTSFSSLCSVPPCCMPDRVKHLETMWYRQGPLDWWQAERAFGHRCDGCALKLWCSGVSPTYLEWFGDEELRPFAPGTTRLVFPD